MTKNKSRKQSFNTKFVILLLVIITLIFSLLLTFFINSKNKAPENMSQQNVEEYSNLDPETKALVLSSQQKLNQIRTIVEIENPTESQNNKLVSTIQSTIYDAQEAVKTQPDVPETWINLARVYRQLSDLQPNANALAEKALIQAIEVAPENYLAYYEISGFYFQSGRYTEAEEEILKAIELNPSNPGLHHNLANIYKQTNQIQKAKESLFEAIALYPDGSQEKMNAEQELQNL